MKHALSILLVLSLLLAFAACGDDEKGDSTYTTSNLPSRYAVDIPKTLKGGSTTPTAPKRVKGLAPQSMALQQIKNDVSQFEMMQKQVPMQFVLVDAVMPTLLQRIGDKTEVSASDLTMTITQTLLDRIKAIMGDELYNEMANMGMPPVGMEFPLGPITYKKSPNETPYQHMIVMEMTNETGSDKTAIRWSTDKTKVSIGYHTVFSGSESSQLCTFDSEKNTSFMSFKFDNMTITMAFEQTDKAKRGVKIKSTSKWTMEGTTTIYETVGVADDNGGYLEMFSTTGTDKWGYRESFNGTGEQTGYAWSTDGGTTWNGMDSFSGDNTYYSEDTTSFAIAEIKVVVNGLPTGSEYDFFIVPSGTTTIDESTTMFGSGHFDGVSMANDTSWVMYWGTENDVANAIVFKAEFNGADMTFSQINGASISVAPAP